MDYTSIHIYGHLLSDDILHEIETESSMQGNREQDFNLDVRSRPKLIMHGAVCVTIGNYFLNVTLFATHTERKLYVVSWNGSFQVLIIS
jgi:hypothetical protein